MEENGMTLDQMLSACESTGQGSWDNANEDWLPPCGTYTVCFQESRFRVFTKGGESHGMLISLMEILEGDYRGKNFEWGFFGNNSYSLGDMKKLYKLLFDGTTPNFADAVRKLMGTLAGRTVEVEIGERVNKKTGDKYPSIKFTRIIK